MKPRYEPFYQPDDTTFRYIRVEMPRLEPYWHYHPELEISFVKRGKGLRFVGDHIGTFQAGDVLMTSLNLPHDRVTTGETGRTAAESKLVYVIQLSLNVLQGFPESRSVMDLCHQAQYGLLFDDFTGEIGKEIEDMEHLDRLERLSALFRLLHTMKAGIPYEKLSSVSFNEENARNRDQMGHIEKVSKVSKFLVSNHQRHIGLAEAAELAELTPQAYCRWFKKAFGQSMTGYLTSVRVERACHLLENAELAVSEIAYQTGFESISNFNRSFKKMKGMSPREWRKGPKAG